MIERARLLSMTSLAAALSAVVLAVALTGCGGPAAYTFPLTFEPADDRNSLAWGEVWCDPLEGKPDTLKRTHEALTDKAAYFLPDIGGRQVIMAVEPDPLRLIIDTDLDGDLSDETPIVHPDPEHAGSVFLNAAIESDSGQVPLAIKCFTSDAGAPSNLLVRAAGVYRGAVTLDGETLMVAIADGSFNGRPNDVIEPGKPADTIGIDFNGDGEFDLWDELRPLPAITCHGKSFYTISAAADGSTITFTPATPKTGMVEITAPGGILSLLCEPGAYRVFLRGEPMPLPVGKYDVYTIQILAWDDQGRRFRMQCLELPEELRSFEIREGETTVLEVGPPMRAVAVPEREGDNVVVNVQVWGAFGERYFPYVRADDGGLEGWAGMKLYDEAGNELDSGGFEYG
jgi:hypothetical protein